MILALPHVLQRPSPNYSPTPIRHDLFIYHDEEGEADPSIAWLCDPRAQTAAQLAAAQAKPVLDKIKAAFAPPKHPQAMPRK